MLSSIDTTWIWSKWLKRSRDIRSQYQNFTHYEFYEDDSVRTDIEENLKTLLRNYHTYNVFNGRLLQQIGYPKVSLAINNSSLPQHQNTCTGNLMEILACELSKRNGYEFPILKLRFNPNQNQSMKGDDVLGFQFSTGDDNNQIVLIGECKFRSNFSTEAVSSAYEALKNGFRPFPASIEFVATLLSLNGEAGKAAAIRQIRNQLASNSEYIIRKYLLMIGTVGIPQNPFQYLVDQGDNILSEMIAINIVFQEDFSNWLMNVYKTA